MFDRIISIPPMKTKIPFFPIVIILLMVFFPYILGWLLQDDAVFSGLLFNPQDGFSYLAKMRQGWDGSWGFTLPYTSDPGEPVPLFLFYLFSGHLARIFHLSLPAMYGIIRFLSSAFLLFMLWDFLNRTFGEQSPDVQKVFWLLALGGGLGWAVTLASGFLTGDFWVAEAYPFLSMFAAPHFSLGLALILLGERLSTMPFKPVNGLGLSGISLLLGFIQPFGVVILGLWLGMRFLVQGLVQRNWVSGFRLLLIAPGFLVLLWQFWLISSHPVLKLWNEQNITAALPWWDWLVSISPMIILAVLGARYAVQRKDLPFMVVAGWILGAILVIYFPFNLQRRFMTGLYIPVGVLGGYGLSQWLGARPVLKKWIWRVVWMVSFLTPLLIVLSTVGAIFQKDSSIYLTSDEVRAFHWMEQNLPKKAVVLAAPQTGLILPAWTGLRVVYGHPFETVRSDESKQRVEKFFLGEMTATEMDEFFRKFNIQYLLMGPREETLTQGRNPSVGTMIYQTGKVRIFRVEK